MNFNSLRNLAVMLVILFGGLAGCSSSNDIEVDLADYVYIEHDSVNNFAISPDRIYTYSTFDLINNVNTPTDLVENKLYTEAEVSALTPTDDTAEYIRPILTESTVTGAETLYNGDVVEITIGYDQEKAKELGIIVTNDKLTHTIRGLRDVVVPADITEDLAKQIQFTDEQAIAKALSSGLDHDFTAKEGHFFVETNNNGANGAVGESNLVYVVELVAEESEYNTVAYYFTPIYKYGDAITLGLDGSKIENEQPHVKVGGGLDVFYYQRESRTHEEVKF